MTKHYGHHYGRTSYPHPGCCEDCQTERVCNSCGADIRRDLHRCTNGRCGDCDARYCTGTGSDDHGCGTRGAYEQEG